MLKTSQRACPPVTVLLFDVANLRIIFKTTKLLEKNMGTSQRACPPVTWNLTACLSPCYLVLEMPYTHHFPADGKVVE